MSEPVAERASQRPHGRVIGWADRVIGEVSKVFVGQSKLVRGVLTALLADGHVLIESVPGLGKTLLVRVLGRVLGCAFSRIQFTPDLMPSDVTGSPIYDERIADFRFRPGPVFTQILLADEINRAPAKTHSALLEIMQESRVTIDGVTHAIEPPFLVMATQNPIESEGTYNLPEAQLDRFLLEARGRVSQPGRGDRHPQAAHPRPGVRSRCRRAARRRDEPRGSARDAAPRSRGPGRRPRARLHFEPGAKNAAVAHLFTGRLAASGRGDPAGGAGRRGARRAEPTSCRMTFRTCFCPRFAIG